MRKWMMTIAALALVAVPFAPVWAQDEPAPDQPQDPKEKQPEVEPPVTPEEAIEMLKEIHGLMEKAEEHLNDSSRGEALATEEEVMKKIDALLKDEGPEAAQKSILQKIEKLLKRTEKKQGKSIDRINELLRRLPK